MSDFISVIVVSAASASWFGAQASRALVEGFQPKGGILLLVRVDTSWWVDYHRRPRGAFAPRVARACVAFAAPGGSRPSFLAARGSRPRRGGALPLGCRFARAGPILGRVVDVSQPPARKTSARRDARVRSYRLVRLWLGGWACAPQSLSSGNTCVNLTSSQRGVGRVVLGGCTRSTSRVGSRILAAATGGGAWPLDC